MVSRHRDQLLSLTSQNPRNCRGFLFLQTRQQAQVKCLLAIAIALLPSAVLAEQFTPQQMLDAMTKSPSNRDVRVQDGNIHQDVAGLASTSCSDAMAA